MDGSTFRHDQTIEQAELESDQRLERYPADVVEQLDREMTLQIEVNGYAVALLHCLDSALAELATGWVFLQGYLQTPEQLDRVAMADERVAVMIQGGNDIAAHRARLMGESPYHPHSPPVWPRKEPWRIEGDILLDVLREAWALFAADRMAEGSVHAAVASERGVEVVGFDHTVDAAVAKVLGWCLLEEIIPAPGILIVNGMITRTHIDAAARIGISVVASPNMPTAEATLLARITGICIVGYMRYESAALLGDTRIVLPAGGGGEGS